MEWWAEIEPKVFNVTKARMKKALADTFPDIFYTSQIQTIKESDFPCVYIHMVDSYEMGEDTERLTINAVNATFQCEAYTNTDQDDCVAIMMAMISQLKKMRFSVVGFPSYSSNGNVFRGVVRARRVIGANDDKSLAP
jgi:hypothetical protein